MRTRTRGGSAPAGRPAPLSGSRPTPERQRHADRIDLPDVNGRAFRPWWRVATRLDGLLRDQLIDPAAWQAASDFRTNYERIAGAIGSPMAGIGLARANHDDRVMFGRLDAVRRLRLIRDRLGAGAYRLVILCVVEDAPWSEIARQLGVSDKTARLRAAEVIMRLAGGDRAESG